MKMPRSRSLPLIFWFILTVGCVPAIDTRLQQEAGPRVRFCGIDPPTRISI